MTSNVNKNRELFEKNSSAHETSTSKMFITNVASSHGRSWKSFGKNRDPLASQSTHSTTRTSSTSSSESSFKHNPLVSPQKATKGILKGGSVPLTVGASRLADSLVELSVHDSVTGSMMDEDDSSIDSFGQAEEDEQSFVNLEDDDESSSASFAGGSQASASKSNRRNRSRGMDFGGCDPIRESSKESMDGVDTNSESFNRSIGSIDNRPKVNSMRPGMIRGNSFDRDDIALAMAAEAEAMVEEEEKADGPQSRLRRTDAVQKVPRSTDSSPKLPRRKSSNDDDHEAEDSTPSGNRRAARRKDSSSAANCGFQRPGMVRGTSCYDDDDLKKALEDDEDEPTTSESPSGYSGNSLRPGMVRGMSCYDDLQDELEESDKEEEETPSRYSVGASESLRPGMVRGMSCYDDLQADLKEDEEKEKVDLRTASATKPPAASSRNSYFTSNILNSKDDDSSSHASGKSGKSGKKAEEDLNVTLTSKSGHGMRPGMMRGMSCYFDEETEELQVLVEGKEDVKTPSEVEVNGRRFKVKRHNSKEDFGLGRVLPTWEEQMKAMAKKKGKKDLVTTTSVSLKDRLKAFQK